jgi:broad specificity phosphatase PhoE
MIPTNINRRDSYTRTYSGSQPLSQHFVEERRQWLRTNGAVQGAHGPVKIQAERIAFSHTSDDEASIRSDDHEGKNFKIIHFQRHGQGYHNLLYRVMQENDRAVTDIYGSDPVANPFVRPEIVDSPLTELGRAQCAEQRQAVVAEYDLTPQLVIVSPLHRALQTAQITFQDSLDAAIPFVAHEACREELGILTCNKRRPLSETKREFPNIDFSLLESGEEDTLWNPLEREAAHDQSKRIYDFLVDFVQHQPQREIAVVGHSAWLFTMCNAVIDCGDDDDLISWFGTAEIRTVKMTWGGDDP